MLLADSLFIALWRFQLKSSSKDAEKKTKNPTPGGLDGHHLAINVPLPDFIATTFPFPFQSGVSLHGRTKGHPDKIRCRQPMESARVALGGYLQSRYHLFLGMC
jgi:hypothetical protein